MKDIGPEFIAILSLINLNLVLWGLPCDMNRKPYLFFLILIVTGCVVYMMLLIHYLSFTRSLRTASQILYHIPWMLQYALKAPNMYLQYPLIKEFYTWSKDIMSTKHPLTTVENILKTTHAKGLKFAKQVCFINIFLMKSPGIFYQIDWIMSDRALPVVLTEQDYDFSLTTRCIHVTIQTLNGFLINSIVMAYNSIADLWCIVIIYHMKTISQLLNSVNSVEDSEEKNIILLECHKMHIETIVWVD